MSALTIKNDETGMRLEAPVPGGLAVLDYRIQSGKLYITHVEVPIESQGKGFASEITRAGFELAKQRGLKAVPICPFAVSYQRRHPELTEDIVA
jgi:predicted GNAT family acetyltransferase